MKNLLLDIPWTGKVEAIAFEVGGLTVQWYGIIITLSMLLGLALAVKLTKRINLTSDDLISLFLWAIPLAIIGARLGHVISRYQTYFTSPYDWNAFVDTIAIWNGGLTIMWGVPAGVLGGFIWSKVHKKNYLQAVDIILPVVLICQALGRWGNFFNQELYGQLITNPNLQWFPMAVFIANKGAWYQATFFYESILDMIGFFALCYVSSHFAIKGKGIFGYAFWYCMVRGSLEFIRDDGSTNAFDNGVNSVMIYCYVIAGIALIGFILSIIYNKKKGNKIFYKHGIPPLPPINPQKIMPVTNIK
ncbi:MAG: prolipoprotein diacylglyceryl transferase [Clostridia bacterium]